MLTCLGKCATMNREKAMCEYGGYFEVGQGTVQKNKGYGQERDVRFP